MPLNGLIENADLTRLSTLATPARARYLVHAGSTRQAVEALAWAATHTLPVQVIGGGSNLVLCEDFPGLVLHMALKGLCWKSVTDRGATLVLAAGENWHQAVLYASRAGYRGVENLALIPGTAGAAPVQNIGAYGAELADTLVQVTAWDRLENREVNLSGEQCRFGYRNSLFKEQPERYLILDVHLTLSRDRPLRLEYGELRSWFPKDRTVTSALEVAEAVMAVRRRKLPDPEQLPNAGSFFKNPVVSLSHWESLKEQWPEMVAYPVGEEIKLAAGWLIDQCGWKGYRNERVGVHHHQALVLVNHSGGTGEDVLELARRIQGDVRETYGVTLDMEPRVVPPDCRFALTMP